MHADNFFSQKGANLKSQIVHCELLKKIQKLFFEEMKLQLDMKSEVLVKLFPELENLVDIHFDFLKQLRIQQVSYWNVKLEKELTTSSL